MGQEIREAREDDAERFEDVLRDHLERAEILAEQISSSILQHIIAMALLELNELDGHTRLQALILREKSRGL